MATFGGVMKEIGKRASRGLKAGADTYAGKETGTNDGAESMMRKVGEMGSRVRKMIGKRRGKRNGNGNGKSVSSGGGKTIL